MPVTVVFNWHQTAVQILQLDPGVFLNWWEGKHTQKKEETVTFIGRFKFFMLKDLKNTCVYFFLIKCPFVLFKNSSRQNLSRFELLKMTHLWKASANESVVLVTRAQKVVRALWSPYGFVYFFAVTFKNCSGNWGLFVCLFV